jgi:oxygen-independent coproporphyrinogen-3 oxidase
LGRGSFVDWNRVERLAASGHLKLDGTRIALTSAGRLLLDHILGEIAAVQLAPQPLTVVAAAG